MYALSFVIEQIADSYKTHKPDPVIEDEESIKLQFNNIGMSITQTFSDFALQKSKT